MSGLRQYLRKKPIDAILQEAQAESTSEGKQGHLKRVLTVKDLTAMGIAAVVGAGIFSTIGEAAYQGGPGISILFVLTAITCGFSAMCYAEFAARIPVSGSAYTYAYASFGELVAWIIGWDLLMEYAIGNIAVSISWSGYFSNLLAGFHIQLPDYFTMDFLSAYRGYHAALREMATGHALNSLPAQIQIAYHAWVDAPSLPGGIKLIADLPALAIVVFITFLVYIGIKETKLATNLMVALKLLVIIGVIVLGFFYVQPSNWSPFLPNGMGGVMKGVSAVFFAYIGFDAISTTAEECRHPQRDLPLGMMLSLLICTILYILVSLVLTGMVPFHELNVNDPLAFVFQRLGLTHISYVISISAVIATASVLLVFQMGQPRIWMSMSRDGLLPPAFSRIHPRFGTPSFSTIVTGIVVAVPALFMNLQEVTDLTSIGTLFAFVLVCGGILFLPADDHHQARFRVPYINGKWVVPILFIVGVIVFRKQIVGLWIFDDAHPLSVGERLPYLLFIVVAAIISAFTYIKNWSLIPVLGFSSCLYLMTELGYTNWLRFLIWLIIGLVVYFTYSRKHSKLQKNITSQVME
ncbi:MAG: amino acid permease [Thermoflavifilum sp.]|nr:amino acid permease [Thermoflavifilum sp.]